jgi:hypothetical protein
MKVTLEFDLEKEDDRREYEIVTASGFMEQMVDDIRTILSSKDLSNDEKVEQLKQITK